MLKYYLLLLLLNILGTCLIFLGSQWQLSLQSLIFLPILKLRPHSLPVPISLIQSGYSLRKTGWAATEGGVLHAEGPGERGGGLQWGLGTAWPPQRGRGSEGRATRRGASEREAGPRPEAPTSRERGERGCPLARRPAAGGRAAAKGPPGKGA